MGKKDTITKNYLNDPCIFADAFNYLLYHGAQVVLPEKLHPLDTVEAAFPYGADGRLQPVQKFRDNFKYLAAMQDEEKAYLLLGVENQSEIHYAMPVKSMIYDSFEHAAQVEKTARIHRRHLKSGKHSGQKTLPKISSGEFLSGFYKGDRLIPVITLVIHFGPEKWDAPMRLHEMMDIKEPELLDYIPDYKINLISPCSIPDEQLNQFHTSLREVLLFIKYSKDKDRLRQAITADSRFASLEQRAGQVIKILTGSDFEIKKEEETINMCKALEDLKEEGRVEGRIQGHEEGRIEGLRSTEKKFVLKLLARKQFSYEEISDMTDVPIERIQEIERTALANP